MNSIGIFTFEGENSFHDPPLFCTSDEKKKVMISLISYRQSARSKVGKGVGRSVFFFCKCFFLNHERHPFLMLSFFDLYFT